MHACKQFLVALYMGGLYLGEGDLHMGQLLS